MDGAPAGGRPVTIEPTGDNLRRFRPMGWFHPDTGLTSLRESFASNEKPEVLNSINELSRRTREKVEEQIADLIRAGIDPADFTIEHQPMRLTRKTDGLALEVVFRVRPLTDAEKARRDNDLLGRELP